MGAELRLAEAAGGLSCSSLRAADRVRCLTLAVHTLRGFTQTGRNINKEAAATPV